MKVKLIEGKYAEEFQKLLSEELLKLHASASVYTECYIADIKCWSVFSTEVNHYALIMYDYRS